MKKKTVKKSGPKNSHKRKEQKSKPSHYVDKKDLLDELIVCQTAGAVSDKLSLMFDKMIEGISHRFPNLQYYGIHEDVKQDCHLLLIQKFRNFKVKLNTSCFAYFTTVIYNQMRYQLTRNRKQKDKRDHMVNEVINYLDSHRDYILGEEDDYESDYRSR